MGDARLSYNPLRQVASGYGPATSPDRGQVFSVGPGYFVAFYNSELEFTGPLTSTAPPQSYEYLRTGWGGLRTIRG